MDYKERLFRGSTRETVGVGAGIRIVVADGEQ